MIPDSEIFKCPKFEITSKTEKFFMNEKVLEEYFVKINEIDPNFYESFKKKSKFIIMSVNTNYLEMMSILLKVEIFI